MQYPSFIDYVGNIWTVCTIHIVCSQQWQAELECQTAGIVKTKTFFFSVHTGTISQLDTHEVMYSVPGDTKALESALKALFSTNQ
jgi:hypothetical protein